MASTSYSDNKQVCKEECMKHVAKRTIAASEKLKESKQKDQSITRQTRNADSIHDKRVTQLLSSRQQRECG